MAAALGTLQNPSKSTKQKADSCELQDGCVTQCQSPGEESSLSSELVSFCDIPNHELKVQKQGEADAKSVTIHPSLAPAMEAVFRAAVSYMHCPSQAGKEPGEESRQGSPLPLWLCPSLTGTQFSISQLQEFTWQKTQRRQKKTAGCILHEYAPPNKSLS